MGFNKRHVSGTGILSTYQWDGIEGIDRYLYKPDALFIPTDDCFARKVYEAWEASPSDFCERMAEEIAADYSEYAVLMARMIELKEQLTLADDSETIKFISDKIFDTEDKIKYYTR